MSLSKLNKAPSFTPLYGQIKMLITQSLALGEWRPGQSIPSEFDLASRFKVSQGTVRKAIDTLAAENILVRRQGKGTFVATHTAERSKYRFLRITGIEGEKEYPVSEVLLHYKRGKADKEIAARLKLKRGAALVILKRVTTLSDKPIMLHDIYLPATLFRGLNGAMINHYPGTLYSLYETHYGIRIIYAEERLRAVMADKTATDALGVQPNTPLLDIERLAYTYGDKPVEWRRSRCNTEQHCYFNKLG